MHNLTDMLAQLDDSQFSQRPINGEKAEGLQNVPNTSHGF